MKLALNGMTVEFTKSKYDRCLYFDCDHNPYCKETDAAVYNKSEVEELYRFIGEVLDKWEEK